MKNKEKYYKLDDIGIVGKQEKISSASRVYHKKKTGAAIQQLRAASAVSKQHVKKQAS